MLVPFSFFDSSGRFARVLRACLCSPEFGPPSTVVHRASSIFGLELRSAIWRCLYSSSCHHWRCWLWFFLRFLSKNSHAAHRDLSHPCVTRRLLRAACSSSATCGSLRLRGSPLAPPTPRLGTAPHRDRWFAVGALAPHH